MKNKRKDGRMWWVGRSERNGWGGRDGGDGTEGVGRRGWEGRDETEGGRRQRVFGGGDGTQGRDGRDGMEEMEKMGWIRRRMGMEGEDGTEEMVWRPWNEGVWSTHMNLYRLLLKCWPRRWGKGMANEGGGRRGGMGEGNGGDGWKGRMEGEVRWLRRIDEGWKR